ncbi:MAG: transporter [Acidobacteria bacterium]|nr:MAG: transporter [Acidobacteriota bacterium]
MPDGAIGGYLKGRVLAVQEFSELLVDALRVAFSPPRYLTDLLYQTDAIGFGSLPIVLLTGFSMGSVLALQTYRTLQNFGEVGLLGQAVSVSFVRELGPVLTGLMVVARNSSSIASELGSMLVSEQVDAMRALGTSPMRKLVAPRLYATLISLPLLTILCDFLGLLGGSIVSVYTAHLSAEQYWTSAYQALDSSDVFQGLIKPVFFAPVISVVGCYCGLHTSGGTEGVGRSTTQAVVVASVLILVLDFFITKFLIGIKFA